MERTETVQRLFLLFAFIKFFVKLNVNDSHENRKETNDRTNYSSVEINSLS